MLDNLFKGLFDTALTDVIGVTDFLLCLGFSLLLGLLMAFAYMYRTRYTKSFVVTLALLPAVVCVVIMMVNGNVGTGVAVAGAFSLVRFRSVPGTAKEIGVLFLAMGVGLIAGMGYMAFAALLCCITDWISAQRRMRRLIKRSRLPSRRNLITQAFLTRFSRSIPSRMS